MEHRSYDELSRLWQAAATPIRLGVVYRASVLFLTPDVSRTVAVDTKEVHLQLGGTTEAVHDLETTGTPWPPTIPTSSS